MPVHNNVFADSSTGRGLANKPTNSHNRKSVNEWEGAGRRAGLCWWKIWLLSTSAFLNTHSYLPSPPEERSFLFFFSPLHHPPLSLSSSPLSPSCSSLFSHFIYLPPSSPFIHFPPFIFIFCQHSPIFFSLQSHSTLLLAPPSSPSPMLSMEQPIQQQNKAAYSITRWLIKQDQNSAALRSTRQHYDTVLHWREEVSLMRRTRGRRGGMEESETAEYTQDTGQKQQN